MKKAIITMVSEVPPDFELDLLLSSAKSCINMAVPEKEVKMIWLRESLAGGLRSHFHI